MINRFDHHSYLFEKKIIWIYIILLIFEGAIRKWILPSLATPLLVIRDPLVLILVIQGLKKRLLLNNLYVKVSFLLSFLAIITSLAIPNEKISVIIFGSRIFLLYFPAIFIISKILTKNDVYKIGRLFILLSIPMTLLVIAQYFSPQSAWVNRGVGGNIEGAGFGGAMGYYRPSGVFSFTQGYVLFQAFVFTFILAYKFVKEFKLIAPINKYILDIAIIMFLITIPLSISRTLLFQTIVILLFTIFGLAITKQKLNDLFKLSILIFLIILILLQFDAIQLFIKVFESRFISAQNSEGDVLSGTIGNRWFGAMLRPWTMDTPSWGNGIGTGTRVGINLIHTKTITDEDWSRIIYESGIIIGGGFIILRIVLSINLLIKGIQKSISRVQLSPILFLPLMLFQLPQGPLGGTVPLGFTILSVSFSIIFISNNYDKNFNLSSIWKRKCKKRITRIKNQ